MEQEFLASFHGHCQAGLDGVEYGSAAHGAHPYTEGRSGM